MDSYTTLGLNHTASLSTIKRTYCHLALLHHPDHNSSNPQAHKEFVRIQCAYEELMHLYPSIKQNQEDQRVCTDPSSAIDTYPIWYDDIPHPSFKYMNGLIVHLRFDAEDLWERHGELLALLKYHPRSKEGKQYGHGYGYGYQAYMDVIGQVISNLLTESEGLETRCGELNGDEHGETPRWTAPENIRKVEELQGELTTNLNSVGVMWMENKDVKELLEGKGEDKVSEKEWEKVVEMLREMAHAPPLCVSDGLIHL